MNSCLLQKLLHFYDYYKIIITLLPNPVHGSEKLPCLSNPIPYPEYSYQSMSAFLFKLTAPNKQFSSVG